MERKHNIRNVSIIGHVGHGKSSILPAACGIRRSSIAPVSIRVSANEEEDYVINIVDTPGEVDFLPEVIAALRITDGALVVVDSVAGVTPHTETVLHQAMLEGIRPVLMVNKIDKWLIDLEVDGEGVYHRVRRIVEDANAIMGSYRNHQDVGEIQVHPELGSVAFTSGLHGWAFTLSSFAKLYASKFGVDESKMVERLWGENYFDTATRKWSKKNTGSPTCKRGFVLFCYKPIKDIMDGCVKDGEKEKLWKMLEKIGVEMSVEEKKEEAGKGLMAKVMQKWLPSFDLLTRVIIDRLPSPATAQVYRVRNLYQVPEGEDNRYFAGIRGCDTNGPLMLYVSKVISSEKGRYYALGRVFSGAVTKNMEVRIQSNVGGGGVAAAGNRGFNIGRVQNLSGVFYNEMSSGRISPVSGRVTAGNMVAVWGIEEYVHKSATVTSTEEFDVVPMNPMSFATSAALRVAVSPRNSKDLPKLLEGLRRISRVDHMVVCSSEERGEIIIGVSGEVHLRSCIKKLRDNFMGGAEIITSDPIISFRETVLEKSCRTVMTKSGNKLNRLDMEACPLDRGLTEAIDDGRIGSVDNRKVLSRTLLEEVGMKKNLSEKIWCFGPDTHGPNMLVDLCKGNQYINQVRESVMEGFQLACKEGALAGEKIRGVSFEICDAVISAEKANRLGPDMTATARRAVLAAELTAKPRLMEPIYRLLIQVPEKHLGDTHNVLQKSAAREIEVTKITDTPLYTVMGCIPATEAVGPLAERLNAATSGQALHTCAFHHWELIPSDPFEHGSKAAELVSNIRKRKGMPEQLEQDEEDNQL